MSIPLFPTRRTGSAIASRDSRCGAAGSAGGRALSIRCRSRTRRPDNPNWQPVRPGFVETGGASGEAGSDGVGQSQRRGRGRSRTAEVEALRAVAAQFPHDALLSKSLDPFSHELKPERLPQADDSLEEREIRCAAVDLGGEAAVDLHDVDRKSLQIGERRIARPEVVERELDTSFLQHCELLLRALTARDEHALGQLERQEAGRQVSALQSILNVLDELRVLELACRG